MGVYPWFSDLGPIEEVPYDEALERYEFDDEIGECFGDYFADDLRQVYVHTGSGHIQGDLDIVRQLPDGAGADIYLVDGALAVDGVLRLEEYGQGALIITGDLDVNHLVVESDAQLQVLGSLRVAGVLVCAVSDAGAIKAAGTVTAEACVVLDHGWTDFEEPPSHPQDPTRRVDLAEEATSDVFGPDLLDENGDVDRERLLAALKAGRPVLTTPRSLLELAEELDGLLAGTDEVTSLDLSRRGLRAIPEQVYDFTGLRRLSLAGNMTGAVLPERLSELTGLEELDLSDMDLAELPDWLDRLGKLRTLDVSGNPLHGRSRHPLALAPFPSVVTRLPGLRVLGLSRLQLAGIPEELSALTGLEQLNLAASLPNDPNVYKTLTRLLPGFGDLRVLRLGRSEYDARGSGYSHTAYVQARDTLLTTVLGLSALEELGIPGWTLGPQRRSGEALTLPDDAFNALPRLRRLDLSQNRLATLPPSLYELEHLEFLDLRHNWLDDTTLRRLVDALPGVRMDLRYVRIPQDLKSLTDAVQWRPDTVPAKAVWDEREKAWVHAETDDEGRRHGLVTYWRPDGTPWNQYTYEHGAYRG